MRLTARSNLARTGHYWAEVFVQVALAERPKHDIYNSGGESLSLGQFSDMVKKVIPDAEIRFESATGGEALSGGTRLATIACQ